MTKKKDRDDLTAITDLEDFEHEEENIDEIFSLDDESEKSDKSDDLVEGIELSEPEEELEINFDDDFPEDDLTENQFSFDESETSSEDSEIEEEAFDLSDTSEPEEDQDLEVTNVTTLYTEVDHKVEDNNEEDPIIEEPPESDFEELGPQAESKVEITPSSPENISEDLNQELSESLSAHIPKHIPLEHIPSFSLKITGIKDRFDGEDILRILREYFEPSEEEENLWIKGIARGEVLIPQIGEYLAISLAHKLRHINADFQLGLSEEIFESPIEEIQKGPVNQTTIAQSKTYSYDIERTRVAIDEVITSTTSQIENAQIKNYLGVVIEEKTVDIDEYANKIVELKIDETQTKNIETFGLKEVYRELTERLKHHAINKGANGVINIQFQNIPLPKINNYYKIVCSGSLVWLEQR